MPTTIAPLPIEAVCLSCKKSKSPALMGSTYEGQGENGMRLKFWVCNPCAIPLSPSSQGPINLPRSLRG